MKFNKNTTCCFTGHRPDKLFGYSLNHPSYQAMAKLTAKHILNLANNHNITTFISGGALGFDMVAFFAVEHAKKHNPNIKNILAVPCEGQSSIWKSGENVDRYNRMLQLADTVVEVHNLPEYKSESFGAKMNRRNDYMLDNSSIVICCWDGTNGGTGNTVKGAKKRSLNIINVRG